MLRIHFAAQPDSLALPRPVGVQRRANDRGRLPVLVANQERLSRDLGRLLDVISKAGEEQRPGGRRRDRHLAVGNDARARPEMKRTKE